VFRRTQAVPWLSLLVWVGLFLAPIRITKLSKMRDFEVYWTAASRAVRAAPLYRVEDEHFQFKYLPAFAVVATPASLLPLDLAKGKWLTISIGLMVALIALSIRVLPERKKPAWVLVCVVVVAMGKFYGHELTLGQVNLAFAILAVAGVLLIGRGHPAAAAAAFVAAVVVKPYAVLFLPWVALVGGWRAMVSATVGMLAVLAAPIGLYGAAGTLDLHAAWWTTVTTSTSPNLTNPDNVSIAAFAAKWMGTGPAASVAATVVSLVLLGFTGVVILRGRGIAHREVLEGALLLTLVPLVSPQGWDYVFLVATPAVALFANEDAHVPRALRIITWIAIAVIGLSLFDVLGRHNYRIFMDWSVITVGFVFLVAALSSLRLRRAA
jgi:hypothetical protein